MSRRRIAALIAVGVLTFVVLTVVDEMTGYAAAPGDRGADVAEVQRDLKAIGYSVTVDGSYGPRTARAVAHFQRANGLRVDSIAGPVTTARLDAAAEGTQPAVRGTQQPAVTSRYAPEGWTGCLEMEFYRRTVGLPDSMDAIGYFQIHTGNFTAPGYRAGIAACGVSQRSDILGNSPEQKLANACVAKVLYDVSGGQPWRL
jgi:peptidoglycan hydrolase-like protein with peptidoglycan-binding domain